MNGHLTFPEFIEDLGSELNSPKISEKITPYSSGIKHIEKAGPNAAGSEIEAVVITPPNDRLNKSNVDCKITAVISKGFQITNGFG